mgnify:CR=1 FL=1
MRLTASSPFISVSMTSSSCSKNRCLKKCSRRMASLYPRFVSLVLLTLGNSVSSWISLKLQVFGTKTTCSSKAIRYLTIAVLCLKMSSSKTAEQCEMLTRQRTGLSSLGLLPTTPQESMLAQIGYQSTRKNVIVSSLYEVFKTDRSCDDRFLWHWFKSSLFTKQIEMLQEGGVRLYFFFDKLQKSEIGCPMSTSRE